MCETPSKLLLFYESCLFALGLNVSVLDSQSNLEDILTLIKDGKLDVDTSEFRWPAGLLDQPSVATSARSGRNDSAIGLLAQRIKLPNSFDFTQGLYVTSNQRQLHVHVNVSWFSSVAHAAAPVSQQSPSLSAAASTSQPAREFVTSPTSAATTDTSMHSSIFSLHFNYILEPYVYYSLLSQMFSVHYFCCRD